MSTEQSPDEENSNVKPADEMPPPAPATQETPPPAPAAAAASTSSAKDKKILAGILAIVLGAYGVHKFVLGYRNEGIIMLVLGIVGWFTCIPLVVVAIVGIIEGVMYLTKTDEEFDRIYIQGRKPWF